MISTQPMRRGAHTRDAIVKSASLMSLTIWIVRGVSTADVDLGVVPAFTQASPRSREPEERRTAAPFAASLIPVVASLGSRPASLLTCWIQPLPSLPSTARARVAAGASAREAWVRRRDAAGARAAGDAKRAGAAEGEDA